MILCSMSVDVDGNSCLDYAMFVVQVFVFPVTAGKQLAVFIVLASLKNVSKSALSNRSRSTLSFYNDLGYKGSIFTPGSQSHLMMFYAEAKIEKYETNNSC